MSSPWPLRLPLWGAHLAKAASAGAGKWLTVVSHHTGVPVAIVAALALVVSWRVARRSGRLAVEFALALGIVVTATKLGWIHW